MLTQLLSFSMYIDCKVSLKYFLCVDEVFYFYPQFFEIFL